KANRERRTWRLSHGLETGGWRLEVDRAREVPFERRRGDVRFVERDPYRGNRSCVRTEISARDGGRHTIEDFRRQHFSGRIPSLEHRLIVEVAVTQPVENPAERGERASDVHDDAVRVEVRAAEFDVDDEGRAVQPLRGAKALAA